MLTTTIDRVAACGVDDTPPARADAAPDALSHTNPAQAATGGFPPFATSNPPTKPHATCVSEVPPTPEDVPSHPEDVTSPPEDVPSHPEVVTSHPEDVTSPPKDEASPPEDVASPPITHDGDSFDVATHPDHVSIPTDANKGFENEGKLAGEIEENGKAKDLHWDERKDHLEADARSLPAASDLELPNYYGIWEPDATKSHPADDRALLEVETALQSLDTESSHPHNVLVASSPEPHSGYRFRGTRRSPGAAQSVRSPSQGMPNHDATHSLTGNHSPVPPAKPTQGLTG